MDWIALLLFLTVIVVLLAGFPVAFTLGGVALIFAAVGVVAGEFNEARLGECRELGLTMAAGLEAGVF